MSRTWSFLLHFVIILMTCITSGGASPRQPGHFQVTNVVRQVTLPFRSFSSLLTLILPFPSPQLPYLSGEVGPLKSSQGIWRNAVSSPSGVWGGATAEIDFGAF